MEPIDPNQPAKEKKYSITRLAELLGRDRRTLKMALKTMPRGSNRWTVAEAEAALKDYCGKRIGDPNLRNQKIEQEIRKLRLINDSREGALVPRVELVRAISTFGNGITPILTQKLVNEFAAMIAGKDAATCRDLCQGLCDELLGEVRRFSEVFKL